MIYRGDAAQKKTRLLTNAFTAGLLEAALGETVNIINATSVAQARGINITETSSGDCENFSSMVSVVLTTDQGKFEASKTIFGNQFLRLVRLNEYHLRPTWNSLAAADLSPSRCPGPDRLHWHGVW